MQVNKGCIISFNSQNNPQSTRVLDSIAVRRPGARAHTVSRRQSAFNNKLILGKIVDREGLNEDKF